MSSSSPLQTELDCFLLLKTQVTHYLESLALILWNGPTGRDHVLFFPPYFWRQTWTDLFWVTNRVMFLPQTQASFMSFQSSVYLCGQSFPKDTEIPLLVTACRAIYVHSSKSSSDLAVVGGGVLVFLHKEYISCMPATKLKPRGQVTF